MQYLTVTAIDTWGIRCLMRAREANHAIRIVNPSAGIRRRFETLGVADHLRAV